MSVNFVIGFLLGHATGFVVGAVLTCVMLKWLERFLLKIPTTTVTVTDIRQWMEANQQIKELSILTRASLDKIAGHV